MEFPGGPEVRILHFHCLGLGSTLVKELRSHKHCVMAKRETYQFNMFKIKLSTEELMLLNCSVGEDSSQTLGWQGDQPSQFIGNQSRILIGRTELK